VIEHLLSVHQALGSILSTRKKERRKKGREAGKEVKKAIGLVSLEPRNREWRGGWNSGVVNTDKVTQRQREATE
jgi:hypothetical protein